MLPREWLEEMRTIRGEVAALRRTIDAFAGVFLNSKFPYGKANPPIDGRDGD